MILSELKIHQVRNISSAHLLLNSRFNFIVGANGSGKTSVLEALYLLSCGHSFRSREISPIIAYNQSSFTVFARSEEGHSISIQKSLSAPTQIKLNGQFCSTTSQLAYALPCQIIYSDIFQIIDAGSAIRRSVLDWGLFHVEPNYLLMLKDYRKILKQRNALLKTSAPYSDYIPWDKQLSTLAMKLDATRQEYFKLWEHAFYQLLPKLTLTNCSIEYYKGWGKKGTNEELEKILRDGFLSDKGKTYTQYGPHQADIIIKNQDIKAKHNLSRGQQKIILIALKLAQGALLKKSCLYLIDDITAELDQEHLKNLFQYLIQHQGQYIITSINTISDEICDPLNDEQYKEYYLMDGTLRN